MVLLKFCLSGAFEGAERRWRSLRREGPQGIPRAGQRSKLRSKARGAGPALRTRGRCVGPGG